MSAIGISTVCQRVRAQVSLRLDNELSQLESRMVDAHLERCATCRDYDADVALFTQEMRSAPPQMLERAVVIERRSRLAFARLQTGVAAAIALVAIGVTAQVALSDRSEATVPIGGGTITEFPTRAELDSELAILEALPTRRTASLGSTTL